MWAILKSLRSLLLNILIAILVIGCIIFIISLDKFWPFLLPEMLLSCAWLFLITGLLLIVSAVYSLVSLSRSTGAPGNSTSTLNTSGPFRWIRNPIYLGDAILLIGLSLLTRSPSLLLVSFIIIAVMHLYVCKVEEPDLEKRFGGDYFEYKSQVPRWFPTLI